MSKDASEGLRYLASALQEVVDRRGKKDLREWDGPAAGTVNAILGGTWTTSPQARGTFDKLDLAGPWRPGTARLLYQAHPTVVSIMTEDGPEYLRTDIDPDSLVRPPGQADPRGRTTRRGKDDTLMDSERAEIAAVAKLLAEAAERLARIGSPEDDERP